MKRIIGAAALTIAIAALVMGPRPHHQVIQLRPGVVRLHFEMIVGGDTEIAGAPGGTTLRRAPDFIGRGLITIRGANVWLHDFAMDGDRDGVEMPSSLPDLPFAGYMRGSGILADGVTHLSIRNVRLSRIAGFAVLVSNSHDVAIDHVEIADSGSLDAAGRNNMTGGILLEEGTTDFRVTRCDFRKIRGNALWTHSLYTSPRLARGLFAGNRFDTVGRDAIQVGHASGVTVEENSGERIGFPVEEVDIEHRAIPVAIDTAGNVDRSAYVRNSFAEIDGKCIDLDGFHDGEIRGNTCVNRGRAEDYRYGNYGIVMNNSNPDMRSRNIRILENEIVGASFGGVFVIGTGHLIARNRLLDLNRAHCGCPYLPDEPLMLGSGIYLGRGASRPDPAIGNTIEDNEITGFQMNTRCIVLAPGIQPLANVIRGNRCR